MAARGNVEAAIAVEDAPDELVVGGVFPLFSTFRGIGVEVFWGTLVIFHYWLEEFNEGVIGEADGIAVGGVAFGGIGCEVVFEGLAVVFGFEAFHGVFMGLLFQQITCYWLCMFCSCCVLSHGLLRMSSLL